MLPQTGALLRDDALQGLFQGHTRTIADELSQLGDVGNPPPHIFEALLIGLPVRHEDNL
jgi:hypothetical protein